MPQPFLKPIVATGVVALAGYAPATQSGVSDEAHLLHANFNNVFKCQESSEYLFGNKAQLIAELRELASDCGNDDWDGYGACAVSATVILQAEAFIRALPRSIPAPEIAMEPDGQVSFDWFPSKTRTFTLSVSAGNRLAYAWIDGSNRGNAAEVFEGGVLPDRLLSELKRITADELTFRIA